jgi:pimeloyl-ACP methyl ester carboxylesterase
MRVLCFAILSLHKFLKIMAITGFSERMYLKYLRTKFKTLALVSPAIAGQKAFELFCTPYPKYKKKKAPAIFHQANPLTVSLPDGIQLKGYEWISQKSNKKTVLIIHGYASYGYKFEQYVAPLLKMGFRVLIFDAPGHGLSQGKYINIILYLNAIEQVIKAVGPVDHFIGHSLGGIALAMLAETIPNPEQHKFVLIAPATKTTTSFNNYFDLMRFSEVIKTAFITYAATLTTHPITHFEADRAIENHTGPVLWVHDAEDKVCPYKDLINFQEKAPKNINFMITKGLGHNKVYKTQAVIDKIMAFLAPED